MLNALNYELTQAEQETIASKIQSSLESATDTYLDTWGDWFGVYRKDGWDDDYYRARIIRELLLKRGTIPAIIDALVDFLNDNDAVIQIYEPWRNIFYTNKSKLNGDDHLMGYYYRFAIIDISIDRPFPPEIVEIIKAFKPAGVLFYLRLDTSLAKNKATVESPYVYLDVTNKTELEFLNGLYYDLRGNINLSDQRTQVVGNNIFHTNNSKLNGEDVLAGAFNHGRGYIHLASTTLLDYTPKATDSMSNLKTTLGEAGSDMYNQTKEKDGRTASIQVPATKNVHTLYSNSIDFGDYDYSGNPNLTPPLSFASFPDKTSDVTLTDEGNGILIESDGSRQLSTTTRSFTPLKNYTNYVMTAQVMVESGFEGNISDLQINYRWLVQDVSDTVWISLGFEDVQPDTWTTLTAQGRSQYNLKGRPYLQIRSKIGTTFKGKLHIKYNIKIEEGVVSTAYQPNLIAEPYFLSNIPINKNMLKAWDAPITGAEYLIGSYEPIKPLEKGTTYTITLNGTKPDNQRFGIYNNNSNGNHLLGYVDPVLGVNNTYRLTFTYSNSTLEELGKIRVYQYPSGTTGNCIINWAKLELGGVATPPIESYTYTGTLVNNTEQPVTDPKKYSWSTETPTNNKKAYMVFDIKTFIEENYATEFEKLVADLGEDLALNAVFENFNISTALKALVSPSSPINFSVELYDFSTSAWHKLNTDSLDLRMRTFNLVANRITDYLNDYKLLFVRYVFDNETDKDVTVELDMLNVLFNYRLGDGYSLGLQSTVECLSEIPLTGITLSSDSVEVAIGETAKVTATPVPANATNKSLEWEIADPKIATVDTSGNITGVAIGETTLTVYGEDKTISATCSVSVKARHTLYSNSTDFGDYDYSGNPNLLSNVTNDSWTAEGAMKVTAVDDYLELVKDTAGRFGTAKIYNIPALRSDSQYTTSLEFYLKSGTSVEDLKKCNIAIEATNTSGQVYYSVIYMNNIPKMDEWVDLTSTFTTNTYTDNLTDWKFRVYVHPDVSASMRIRNSIKIEKGSTATAYQPNLLDDPYWLGKVPLGENIANKDIQFPIKTSEYLAYIARMIEPFIVGETYTITIKATKPASQTFMVYNSGEGTTYYGNLKPVEGLTNVWSLTFTPNNVSSSNPSDLRIFQYPSSTKGDVQIDWLKIEKGDTRTPNIDSYAYRGTVLTTSEESPKDPNAYTWSSI
ncbi:hypothetical protein PEf771_24 [Enterococcus phage PEf771]|uniref:BIG2 domain-containing protein n=1 Tax=Enterococcus phage PEf771 TaxID=2601638 RepID=A0A5C2H637_9CAUD|nr:hypothetical protein PEf771_24 [Enterococcus phage PEf771]